MSRIQTRGCQRNAVAAVSARNSAATGNVGCGGVHDDPGRLDRERPFDALHRDAVNAGVHESDARCLNQRVRSVRENGDGTVHAAERTEVPCPAPHSLERPVQISRERKSRSAQRTTSDEVSELAVCVDAAERKAIDRTAELRARTRNRNALEVRMHRQALPK